MGLKLLKKKALSNPATVGIIAILLVAFGFIVVGMSGSGDAGTGDTSATMCEPIYDINPSTTDGVLMEGDTNKEYTLDFAESDVDNVSQIERVNVTLDVNRLDSCINPNTGTLESNSVRFDFTPEYPDGYNNKVDDSDNTVYHTFEYLDGDGQHNISIDGNLYNPDKAASRISDSESMSVEYEVPLQEWVDIQKLTGNERDDKKLGEIMVPEAGFHMDIQASIDKST